MSRQQDTFLDTPPEILAIIFMFMGKRSRIASSFTCKLLFDVIQNHVGYHCITISNTVKHKLDILSGSPLLKNTTIIAKLDRPTDEDLSKLAGVRNLALRCIYFRSPLEITSKGFEALAGVHTIDLNKRKTRRSYAAIDYITDDCIKHLHGVHTIDLGYCCKITDKGLKALSGVHTINLSGYNTDITVEGYKAISGVHTINICSAPIEDDGLLALSGVKSIVLRYCKRITSRGIMGLVGAFSIDLTGCKGVCDKGINYLLDQDEKKKVLKKLYIRGCSKISRDVTRRVVNNVPQCDVKTDKKMYHLQS